VKGVSIFDLTDAQIDMALAARRARPEVRVCIERNRVWDAEVARRARRSEDQRIAQTRRCSRCGIDTIRPDMCLDCEAVCLWDAS